MELFHNPMIAGIFIPALLLAVAIEALLYVRMHGRYPWRDGLASLAITLGHSLSGIVSHAVITTGIAVVVWRYRVATVDMGNWWNVVLLFVLVEFAYYWYHREAHLVRLLWSTHRVHHSPEELTLLAAGRLNWTPVLSFSWLFYMPLVWIGFDPVWVFGMVSASLVYQFWLHTTLIPRLGPLEGILNTPSAHRVHHASNGEYLDRNFGGTLMLFDRLFGTYIPEDPDIPLRFGLVHPDKSLNPLVLLFREYAALLRDVWRTRSWRERFGYVFARPGWRPDGAAPEGRTAGAKAK